MDFIIYTSPKHIQIQFQTHKKGPKKSPKRARGRNWARQSGVPIGTFEVLISSWKVSIGTSIMLIGTYCKLDLNTFSSGENPLDLIF